MRSELKKIFFLLAFGLVVINCAGQKIYIDGIETNRKLKWSDFTPMPNKISDFAALTYYDISYKMSGLQFKNGQANIESLTVTLSLNKTNSWSIPEKQTEKLLKHEQGHFDIGILCMYEMQEKLNKLKLKKQTANAQLKSTFNEVLEKYTKLQVQYDEETDHSKNEEKQVQWNDFFAQQLAIRNHIQTEK